MKLQYLAIIFIIIVLPIVVVLAQYVDYQIDAINLRKTYDVKLLNATHDTIKAFQLNTINNAISDISASKIENLEAAVKTFFNSISNNFNYTGYKTDTMKSFVPAVVFTLYDGYYIYSPFHNTLTGVPENKEGTTDPYVATDFSENDKPKDGIKPYVYYSCRYKKPNIDVVITYTLDNYITVQGLIGSKYVNESGYLIDDIKRTDDAGINKPININKYEDEVKEEIDDYTYVYEGFKYSKNTTEQLKEYLGKKEYSYIKLNGTKYYLSGDEIFYINANGEKAVQTKNGLSNFKKFKKMIEANNSAYRYYREAYLFTSWVREHLKGLTPEDVVNEQGGDSPFKGQKYNIFEKYKDTEKNYIHESDSNFNEHRQEVIKHSIEQNLSAAIAGYKKYYTNDTNIEYNMPKINDIDWNTLENNVSVITFLQGFTVGGREYNKYCVVANTLTKEYVDEDDIYLLDDQKTYYKANDGTLDSKNILNWSSNKWNGYAAGIWKINFERKSYQREIGDGDDNYQTYYYYPISDTNTPYIGSYSSVISSTSVKSDYGDMYKYMRSLTDSKYDKIKNTYYTALARERWGAYAVNKDIDLVQPEPEPIPPDPPVTPDPTDPTDPTDPSSPEPVPGSPVTISDNSIIVVDLSGSMSYVVNNTLRNIMKIIEERNFNYITIIAFSSTSDYIYLNTQNGKPGLKEFYANNPNTSWMDQNYQEFFWGNYGIDLRGTNATPFWIKLREELILNPPAGVKYQEVLIFSDFAFGDKVQNDNLVYFVDPKYISVNKNDLKIDYSGLKITPYLCYDPDPLHAVGQPDTFEKAKSRYEAFKNFFKPLTNGITWNDTNIQSIILN